MSHKEVARNIVKYFNENSKQGSTLSPICQRILGTVANEIDGLGWLVDASLNRTPLETSLLLMAGMHRQVLLDAREVHSLRDYYQSVGGNRDFQDSNFSSVFLEAMHKSKDKLSPIIQNETIQTNETQRGLFWLLPAIISKWEELHLVDLGASAGLNLVADQRRFTLSDSFNKETSFGLASNEQFVTQMKPACPDKLLQHPNDVPSILSRNGCDLHPFPIETELSRSKLESFVWPDQVQRFCRLKEGIDAHNNIISNSKEAIAVAQVDLPHGLQSFLESLDISDDNAPVLIYNTYMTTYLENEGRDLRRYIHDWATNRANRSVMWVQAEPAAQALPLKHHWCAWTVDLWENGSKRDWQLAWTHPHGTEMELLPGLDSFMEYHDVK